eukprot:CAMPEP_0206473128 /NCGR_PEP_ID=MMETSP0324_2-20121206/32654_1 /ASSEMBLY_ACC=CAM_ASM_000836 /TAXON_ID=2866 /ORGANISM="Crypthecodinium cohnii, Strain Seligo" /LENGTH=297 /DNA_ID=CAMNT_0053947945 /DNA_START=81 /DNA_END=971 /DNA_ORIENTATION=-
MSAVWGVRILAVLCFVFGTHGMDTAVMEDVQECPRFSKLALFWAAMRYWAAFFLFFDFCFCAFFLRLQWISFHIQRIARVYTAMLTLITVFGLGNYGLLIKEQQCCIDCVDRCCAEDEDEEFSLGKWCCSCPCCCCSIPEFFSLEPWRADQDSDEENPSLMSTSVSERERGKHSGSASSQAVGGKKLLFPPMPSSTGGPSPTTLGQSSRGGRSTSSRNHSTRNKEIRVYRGSELLHVGRARGAVRRWLRRNIQDTRDIVIQDSTGPPLREAMAAAAQRAKASDEERSSPGSKSSRPQ